MANISLPSGVVIDFGDLSQAEIEDAISKLQAEKPELFEEKERSFREMSSQEIIARAEARGKQKKEEESGATNEGEIQDVSFQAFYAKADTNKGREMRLEREFGPGTFERVGPTDYVLLLDKVSIDKKKQYGLPDEGTIRVNKHGFSMYDVAAFVGKWQGPLVATLGAGLIASRLPVYGAMAVMAAAGGAGKAYDELLEETRQGLQDQTDKEVYGEIALEALLLGGFEGVFRGLFAAGRRLIKGPGTINDEAVASMVESGVPLDSAKGLSREQSRVQTRAQVRQGAAPTIYEATGKPIMGRLQAIWDGIFPNNKAAFKNRQYVNKLLEQHTKGDLSDEALKRALAQNAKDISDTVRNAMADPNQAIRLANRHTREVIEKQMEILTSRFVPGRRQARDFESILTQMGRLFRQESSVLYANAEHNLVAFGPELAQFNSRPIRAALAEILKGDTLKAKLTQDIASKDIFAHMATTPSYSASELNTLRHILRMKAGDPGLVGTLESHQIGQLTKTIDQMIKNKADELSAIAKIAARSDGPDFLVLPTGTALKMPLDPTKFSLLREGVEQLIAANKHYADNMSIFNSGAANMITKSIRDGYWVDLKSVTEFLVKPGQPQTLKKWIDAVTPSAARMGVIQKIDANVWSNLANRIRNTEIPLNERVDFVNRFLAGNNPLNESISKKVLGRLPLSLKDLPDSAISRRYAQRIMSEYADFVDQMAADSLAKTPRRQANLMREMLASDWIQTTMRTSQTGAQLNPASFANKFFALGDDVQNLLVGQNYAAGMRKSLKDYYLLGLNANAYKNTLLANVSNPAIRNKIASVQNTLREAEEQSVNSVFRAVKDGKIDDADSLIYALIKNPKMVEDLKRIPQAEAQFNAVGGVRDAAMHRIVLDSFPDGITSDIVASGAFGQNMKRTIEKMNANGSLARILDTPEKAGQQVVNELLDVAKQGISVSDLALKGKGGLAAPSFVAGLTLAHWATSGLSLLGPVIGTYAMGRIIRMPFFLNWVTKPRFRVSEIKKGIEIAADEIMKRNPALSRSQALQQARASLGDRNIAYQTFKENVASEIRAVSAISTGGAIEEVQEEIITPIREVVQQNALAGGEGDDRLGAAQVRGALGVPTAQAAPPQDLAQVAQAQETPEQRAARVLASIEQAKLTGAPVIA